MTTSHGAPAVARQGSKTASYVLCVLLALPALLIFYAVALQALPLALLVLPTLALVTVLVRGAARS